MDKNAKPKEKIGNNDNSRKRRKCTEASDGVEPKKEAIDKREPPTFVFVDRRMERPRFETMDQNWDFIQETIPDPNLQVLFYFFMTYSDLVLLNLMKLIFPEDDKNPITNRTYCGICGIVVIPGLRSHPTTKEEICAKCSGLLTNNTEL